MKLYAWQPQGHGEVSFFVIAESELQAIECVNAEIARRKSLPWLSDGHFLDYDFDGWGTDYYTLTVAEVGQVITNAND